jgi:hypothetical protein
MYYCDRDAVYCPSIEGAGIATIVHTVTNIIPSGIGRGQGSARGGARGSRGRGCGRMGFTTPVIE